MRDEGNGCGRDGLAGRVARTALVVAGIVLIGVWSNLLGYSAELVPAQTDAAVLAASSKAYLWGRTALAFVLLLLARPLEVRMRSHAPLVAVALAPVALVMALAVRADAPVLAVVRLLNPGLVVGAASFVESVGFLYVSLGLFMTLARLVPSAVAAPCAMAGIVGECLATAGICGFASLDFQLALCTVAPPLAVACLAAATHPSRTGGGPSGAADAYASALASNAPRSGHPGIRGALDVSGTVLMLFQLALAMVLAAFLRTTGVIGSWGADHTGYLAPGSEGMAAALPACLFVVAVALLVFTAVPRLPSQVRYTVALVVILTGVQLPGVLSGLDASVVGVLGFGCQLLGRLLIWVIFMDSTRQLAIAPLRIDGIATLFNTGTYLVLTYLFGNGAAQAEALVPGLMYTLLLVTLLLVALPFVGGLRSGGAPAVRVRPADGARAGVPAVPGSHAGSAAGSALAGSGAPAGSGVFAAGTAPAGSSDVPAGSPEAPDMPFASGVFAAGSPVVPGAAGGGGGHHGRGGCPDLAGFAVSRGLSRREAQVFALLYEGRTRGEIERLLGLSEGTVRTHVNNVYHKLGVHSKDEARQALETWRAG